MSGWEANKSLFQNRVLNIKAIETYAIDLCGPTRIQTLKCESYFMLLIDDYTRMTWVTIIKEKYEAFEKSQDFKSLVENETDLQIKCLISDRGGDFSSYEFDEFYENHGIKRHFSVVKTPYQNGFIEMKNITI
jgi:transposase InsO family protein